MADPRAYTAAETLRNGLAITIRALRPDDRERVAAAVRGLERDSIYFRFFSYRKDLSEQGLDRIMVFDPEREVVLLATTGAAETVIGSGRYVVESTGSAEVAFMVEEDYHGQGIASRLLHHLAHVAKSQGIMTFEADVLAENKAMLAVFARTGWPVVTRREGSIAHVTMNLPDASG